LVDEVAAIVGHRHSARQLVRIAKAAKQHPLRAELPRVRCPVLLLWGAQDHITPPAVAREFQALLPQAELQFIDRCGHAPMLEQPAAFGAFVREFLERVAPTA
jgi:pimeloyl-ACP methyl ester carboxylesterase